MSFEYRLDVSRCIGCRACEVACVTANRLDPAHSRNWVLHLEGRERRATFFPYLCMHCADSPCVPACPTGASFRAPDGRVLVDTALCIGCGMCVPACPYGARFVDPASNLIEKCTLCEGRVEHGLAPACFEVCPAGARTFHEVGPGHDVAVGDPERPDPGHETLHLTTPEVDPHPRLVLSGEQGDLDLVRALRPPVRSASVPGRLWRNGVGVVMQGLGVASALALGAALGLRLVRRRAEVAETTGDKHGGEPPRTEG